MIKSFSALVARSLAPAAAIAVLGLIPAAASAQSVTALPPSAGAPSEPPAFVRDNPNARGPVAIVNGEVVTGTDIDQRLALVIAASQSTPTGEEMQLLRARVLQNLINETLQIQEAKAQEMTISKAQIEQAYKRVAAQSFGQDTGKMDSYLSSVGSSPASLKRQIEGELAWQQLIGRNVTPFINVSREEVAETLKRIEADRGTDEYRVAEIYISATPETRPAVAQNGQKIMDQIRAGGNFTAYARQFSEATTAAVGGDLGWVRLAQLPGELSNALSSMQVGQVAGPVEIPGGFSILYLRDKRQVATANARDSVLSLMQISIDFPPGMSEADANRRAAEFTNNLQRLNNCETAQSIAQSFGAQTVANTIAARNLPEQLQNALLTMNVGDVTPPFGSIDEGVRALMVCGKEGPENAGGPDFDSLMNQLEEERISKRAESYLRDLRNDAVIEIN